MEEKILEVLEKYKQVICEQQKDKFYDLWSKTQECKLISIVNEYIGVESIYKDFLIGGIQAKYQKISLIADKVEIQIINEMAIVIFEYHTECVKRDTGENYGIKGIETQIMILEKDEWKLLYVHYSKE